MEAIQLAESRPPVFKLTMLCSFWLMFVLVPAVVLLMMTTVVAPNIPTLSVFLAPSGE